MTAVCQQGLKKYQVVSIKYQDFLDLLFVVVK